MPYYMLQAAYEPEAWKALVKNPQNRLDVIRPVVEKLGGKVEGGWLAFGEYDNTRSPRAEAFLTACKAGGINADVPCNILLELWQKFLFLTGTSSTTAAMRSTIFG